MNRLLPDDFSSANLRKMAQEARDKRQEEAYRSLMPDLLDKIKAAAANGDCYYETTASHSFVPLMKKIADTRPGFHCTDKSVGGIGFYRLSWGGVPEPDTQ